ncbi:MAG: efflux RND transporter periplasmic adaptor subunit [Planctomycetes bacterium]|nr:efflux RND transporter periplasmic adaptor subunit [Planctomycetota bacterium]
MSRFAAVALAAAASLATGCGRTGDGPAAGATPAETPAAAPEGTWVPVRRATVRQFARASGSLAARRMVRLGPQVSGKVLEVLADVGDVVHEKQDLVKLDPELFRIEVARKHADVDAAQTEVDQAQLNLTRMKNLWEKPEGQEPSIPRKLLDDAQARADSAAARKAQAAAGLAEAEEKLRQTVVKAPWDGVVSARFVDPGESVTSTPISHLLEIQDVATLELEFPLPQELLPQVKKGTSLEFEADGVPDVVVAGVVDSVRPAMDRETRSFWCRATVENAAGRFHPGLHVRVRVVERTAEAALVVPREALRETVEGWTAVARGATGPETRAVKIGLSGPEGVEIVEGIAEGDSVLVPGPAR